jgi:hypothetical protein
MSHIVTLLANPKLFNIVILCLYAANIVRWLVAGSYADACYWASAFAITATVTFGYEH